MNSFKINVNHQNNFEVSEKQAFEMDAVQLNEREFHLLKDHQSYAIEVLDKNFNQRKYSIKVNHTEYEVDISTALDSLIKDLGFEVGATKQISAIKAPMPGLILSINVKEGQEVAEGDSLLVLEAMKMENNFNSPRAGIIQSIVVNQGQAVDKGQVLIEFE